MYETNTCEAAFTDYTLPEARRANIQAQLEISDLCRLLTKYPRPSIFMANVMAMKAEKLAKLIKKTARD